MYYYELKQTDITRLFLVFLINSQFTYRQPPFPGLRNWLSSYYNMKGILHIAPLKYYWSVIQLDDNGRYLHHLDWQVNTKNGPKNQFRQYVILGGLSIGQIKRYGSLTRCSHIQIYSRSWCPACSTCGSPRPCRTRKSDSRGFLAWLRLKTKSLYQLNSLIWFILDIIFN